jgi:hypothetical protein
VLGERLTKQTAAQDKSPRRQGMAHRVIALPLLLTQQSLSLLAESLTLVPFLRQKPKMTV